MATALDLSGRAQLARGHPEQAETLQRQALAIRERNLGPDHPYTLAAGARLALLMEALQRLPEATALAHALTEAVASPASELPEDLRARLRVLVALPTTDTPDTSCEALRTLAETPGSAVQRRSAVLYLADCQLQRGAAEAVDWIGIGPSLVPATASDPAIARLQQRLRAALAEREAAAALR